MLIVHTWSNKARSDPKLIYYKYNRTDTCNEKITGEYIVDHVNIKPLNDGWLTNSSFSL